MAREIESRDGAVALEVRGGMEGLIWPVYHQ